VSERVEELCKSIKQMKADNEMEGREQIYSSKPLSNALSREGQRRRMDAYSPVWRLKLRLLADEKKSRDIGPPR